MGDFLFRWIFVVLALVFTITASGSMAMIAMNTWGVQCPRPVSGLLWQGFMASLMWVVALSINTRESK